MKNLIILVLCISGQMSYCKVQEEMREITLQEVMSGDKVTRACVGGVCTINGSCSSGACPLPSTNACCASSCVRPNSCNPCTSINACNTCPNPCQPCNPCSTCPNPCNPCSTTCSMNTVFGFFGFDADGAITDQSNTSLFSVMPVTPPSPALRAYKITFCTPFCCLPSPVVSVSVPELIWVTNVTVQSFQVNLENSTSAMVFFQVGQVS